LICKEESLISELFTEIIKKTIFMSLFKRRRLIAKKQVSNYLLLTIHNIHNIRIFFLIAVSDGSLSREMNLRNIITHANSTQIQTCCFLR